MTVSYRNADEPQDLEWRAPAPRARKAAMALYAWREPKVVLFSSLAAGLAFVILCALSPALLSFAPTIDMIAPIAEARAVVDGAASLKDAASPLHTLLIVLADIFVEAPGRIHLVAKALAAGLVAAPLAFFLCVRFPAAQTILFCAGMAAFVAAPFAGEADIALALYVTFSAAMVAGSAHDGRVRAIVEGGLAGALLFSLWLANPAFSLAGFLTLAACPFVTGPRGLDRYAATLAIFAGFAVAGELLFPGLNAVRADAASAMFGAAPAMPSGAALGLAGLAASTLVVIFAAGVFGGRAYWRGWAIAGGLLALAVLASRIAGANPMPVFALAAAMACLSVASPFYDGVFRNHDRASVSMAIAAASLTLFWTAAIVIQAAGQITLQARVANAAPDAMRTELGLVQPGGPTVAKWIEEGRFSTPEARDLFAFAPIDQSMMLLDVAERTRKLQAQGHNVAILTGADTACVLGAERDCRTGGAAAASDARVVFVPRIDLGAASVAARASAEVLLYTEFKMVEQTAFWDVWVRREAATLFGASE